MKIIKRVCYFTLHILNVSFSGLGGKTRLIDIGGPPFLLPTVKREKLYTFDKLNEVCGGVEPAFFIGAGAGPFPHAGTNCEVIYICVTLFQSIYSEIVAIFLIRHDLNKCCI